MISSTNTLLTHSEMVDAQHTREMAVSVLMRIERSRFMDSTALAFSVSDIPQTRFASEPAK